MKGRVGFIGAGNMANSLISGLLKGGVKCEQILASSPEKNHLKILQDLHNVRVSFENKDVVESCSTLVIAVKPDVIKLVLNEINSLIRKKNHLIISIAAGVKIREIEKIIGKKSKIIRCMPNTPASVGKSVTAICNNTSTKQGDVNTALKIFNSIGVCYPMKEKFFDLFTSLIGSGPAYIFYIIEIFEKIAKDFGFGEKKTRELVLEMIMGSTSLAKSSDEKVKLLRKKVTSPKGVTEKAIEVLESKQVALSFEKAIREGEKRSAALGDKKDA